MFNIIRCIYLLLVYGHYMYLDSYNGSNGDIAYSRGPSVEMKEKSCLTFWYHMFGTHVGMLNVTLNNNPIWFDYGDKGDIWNLAELDIDSQGYLTFEFVGIYGSGLLSDIAVDDILLLPGSCSGVIDHQQICVNLDREMHTETYCPKGYLDLPNVLSNPEKTNDYCSIIYYQTKLRLLDECKGRTDSQKCLIDLSTDISFHPECFQLFVIRIHHTCEEEDTSVSSDITSTGYSNTEKDTSVSSDITSTGYSNTGLVVGLVIGVVVLVPVVFAIFIFIRRNIFKSNQRENKGKNLRENDYIGSQAIALPPTTDHSSHVQYFDNQITNDDEYSIVDQAAETCFNKNKDNPVKDTRTKIDDEGQYAISDGVYDRSGNNRHKESEDTIYNHSVDTIYDSGSHKRNDEGREDTYDHFIGQQTEDEYNISTTH